MWLILAFVSGAPPAQGELGAYDCSRHQSLVIQVDTFPCVLFSPGIKIYSNKDVFTSHSHFSCLCLSFLLTTFPHLLTKVGLDLIILKSSGHSVLSSCDQPSFFAIFYF